MARSEKQGLVGLKLKLNQLFMVAKVVGKPKVTLEFLGTLRAFFQIFKNINSLTRYSAKTKRFASIDSHFETYPEKVEKKLIFEKWIFWFPVREKVVSESYSIPWGYFWHWEIDKRLKIVSFAYLRYFVV